MAILTVFLKALVEILGGTKLDIFFSPPFLIYSFGDLRYDFNNNFVFFLVRQISLGSLLLFGHIFVQRISSKRALLFAACLPWADRFSPPGLGCTCLKINTRTSAFFTSQCGGKHYELMCIEYF